ncbi:hypothetical protein SAMN02982917_2015 [Azospirillum oryzae]|uniref:Uncharacterized protein n=1 Tax=Azospirillum oryzae TaxID=286727 RepID=A0A1X7ETU4_9PROT|nr:hypothetical protein SAMN02982917_2015 [Azospirillum oryzae]
MSRLCDLVHDDCVGYPCVTSGPFASGHPPLPLPDHGPTVFVTTRHPTQKVAFASSRQAATRQPSRFDRMGLRLRSRMKALYYAVVPLRRYDFFVSENHRCIMTRKNRDFGALAEGLANLRSPAQPPESATLPTQVTPPPAEPAPPAPTAPASTPAPKPAPRGRGRPPEDTEPLQLRIPRTLMRQLVREAADASIQAGKNITPQQIILRILEARYNTEDQDRG